MIHAHTHCTPDSKQKALVIELSGESLTELHSLLARALSHSLHDYPDWLQFQDKLEEYLAKKE